jgi:putative hydrolases of HD superfamily
VHFIDSRMAMLAFAVRDTNVNRDRLIKICLVHDLAEAVVGDITPFDGVSKEDKRVLEEVEELSPAQL